MIAYGDFLTRVIDEGIAAATADYARPEQADQLRGSVDGFELCRWVDPHALRDLCTAANQDANRRHLERAPEYWYWRCRALEVEWVCNVLSAVLVNEGFDPILPHQPTANGMRKAATIVGVRVAD